MSSKYAATAQRSLAAITRKGADVSFATISGTPIFDPDTNTWSGSTDTIVAGKAVQVANDLNQLVALGLVTEKTVTLLVAAKSLAVTPTKGMVMTWAGSSWNVDDVQSVAPDGTPILFTVVASS